MHLVWNRVLSCDMQVFVNCLLQDTSRQHNRGHSQVLVVQHSCDTEYGLCCCHHCTMASILMLRPENNIAVKPVQHHKQRSSEQNGPESPLALSSTSLHLHRTSKPYLHSHHMHCLQPAAPHISAFTTLALISP